jgi:hypothetical protein
MEPYPDTTLSIIFCKIEYLERENLSVSRNHTSFAVPDRRVVI